MPVKDTRRVLIKNQKLRDRHVTVCTRKSIWNVHNDTVELPLNCPYLFTEPLWVALYLDGYYTPGRWGEALCISINQENMKKVSILRK